MCCKARVCYTVHLCVEGVHMPIRFAISQNRLKVAVALTVCPVASMFCIFASDVRTQAHGNVMCRPHASVFHTHVLACMCMQAYTKVYTHRYVKKKHSHIRAHSCTYELKVQVEHTLAAATMVRVSAARISREPHAKNARWIFTAQIALKNTAKYAHTTRRATPVAVAKATASASASQRSDAICCPTRFQTS